MATCMAMSGFQVWQLTREKKDCPSHKSKTCFQVENGQLVQPKLKSIRLQGQTPHIYMQSRSSLHRMLEITPCQAQTCLRHQTDFLWVTWSFRSYNVPTRLRSTRLGTTTVQTFHANT
jgi:hypothetical protein